jgi:hypothetical protein
LAFFEEDEEALEAVGLADLAKMSSIEDADGADLDDDATALEAEP